MRLIDKQEFNARRHFRLKVTRWIFLIEGTIAIACADLHLDEFAWSDRRAIHGDSMWSFKWIMDLSQEHDLPVIMAGDVLDKPINNATVANFIRLNITKSSLVAFIQGQHCRQQMTPWLSALDDFYENEPVTHWLGDRSYNDGFGYAKINGLFSVESTGLHQMNCQPAWQPFQKILTYW
jgi:hypothetical protein